MRRSKRVLLVQLFSFYLLSVSQTSASIFPFITNSLYLNFFKLCTSFVFTQDTKIVTGLTALIFGLSVNVFISLLYLKQLFTLAMPYRYFSYFFAFSQLEFEPTAYRRTISLSHFPNTKASCNSSGTNSAKFADKIC